MPFDPLEPLQVEEIRLLFATVSHWSSGRWRSAISATDDCAFRAKRGVARLLCDAIIATEQPPIADWLVRDLARTAAETLGPRKDRRRATEMLEDAALALLARASLARVDQAVLLRPCLPLPLDRVKGPD